MKKRKPQRTSPFPARHRQSRRTRAAILSAASTVFAEGGLAGARTEAIAEAAGVNKALLYYYFNGKEALYQAVIEEYIREFRRRALATLALPRSVRATLLAYVSMHFDYIAGHPDYPLLFQRFMMVGGRGLVRLVRKYFLPLRKRLMAVITRGVVRGELRPVDAGQAVFSLVGLTVYYFAVAPMARLAGEGDLFQEKRLAARKQEILDFIRYGLFKHPEEPWE